MPSIVGSVGWGCAFCDVMLWQEVLHVCVEQHVAGSVGSLGSVGASARIRPSG